MKILNSDRMTDKIVDLFEREALNMTLRTGLFDPIAECSHSPLNRERFRRRATLLQNRLKKQGMNLSVDESLVVAMVNEVSMEGLKGSFPDGLLYMIAKESQVYHGEEFHTNSFLQNISLEEIPHDVCQVVAHTYEKYELFQYLTPSMEDEFVRIPRLALFDTPRSFPSLYFKDTHHVSLTPYRMNLTEKAITACKGNVLHLGLDMGYFSYMALCKDEVTSVTIVEKNAAYVAVFLEYILPQFPRKNCVKIVHADPLEYIQTLDDGSFDFCFANVCKNERDIIPYLQLQTMQRNFPSMELCCYNEDMLLVCLRYGILTQIMKTYLEDVGMDTEELPKYQDKIEELDTYVAELCKDIKINLPEQIDSLISYKGVRKLIANDKQK